MIVINDLIISLCVLFVTRIFASIVFLELAIRNKTVRDSVLSFGWLIYAIGPFISIINFQQTGDIINIWLAIFTIMGTFCILLGLILFYLPVSIKKAGTVFIILSLLVAGILFMFPKVSMILTVSSQMVLLLSTALIIFFRRKWILKIVGVSSYIWLLVFFIFSLVGTSLHLFFPMIAQSVKFFFTFIINLLLFMTFLHFNREHSFRRIKENEAEITKSFREKEILLKEIHHRVNNNMAIMISLLNLQSSTSENPVLREQLEKAQHRIETMALIHEYLYETKNLNEIHFKDYAERLIAYFKTFLENGISIRVNVDDFRINPDLLISCGLIINEIISNANKHAFTKSENKYISLFAKVTKEPEMGENIQLILKDNGKGLPQSIDPARWSEGIGFQLIQSLCIQLKAKMDIKNDHGTVYHFIIPNQFAEAV